MMMGSGTASGVPGGGGITSSEIAEMGVPRGKSGPWYIGKRLGVSGVFEK